MVNLLFDSWRGHTLDNGIVDLDDNAFMVMVEDEEEEEESPQKPTANDDEAGPSGANQDKEPQEVDADYTDMFRNLAWGGIIRGGEKPVKER
jgi:hypothetical protein